MNSSTGECSNAAVMSNTPMYVVSFEFLLAASAKVREQPQVAGCLQRHRHAHPYATCCATNQAFTAISFMSCSHLDHTFVRDPTSLSPTTSNTSWSCMCSSSLARALCLRASWHIGAPDLVAYTCFSEMSPFFRRWTERPAMCFVLLCS